MTRERCCCRALDVRQSTVDKGVESNFISNARAGAPCAEEYTNSKNLLQPDKRTTVLAESRLGYTPICGTGWTSLHILCYITIGFQPWGPFIAHRSDLCYLDNTHRPRRNTD